MRVCHIINGLGVGGAEKFLWRLADELSNTFRVEQLIISLQPRSEVGIFLDRDNIQVQYLNLNSISRLPGTGNTLKKAIDEFNPDIIQSWLYISDFSTCFYRLMNKDVPIIWNIRCSDIHLTKMNWLLVKICARLSQTVPKTVVVCGNKAKDVHIHYGYDPEKMLVINNGYYFPPLDEQRISDRPKTSTSFIIGAAGRFDNAKDYGLLLRAFGNLVRSGRDTKLIIVGRDCTYENSQLTSVIQQQGIGDRVELRGQVSDMNSFFDELDLFCLSSVSEGFPNVVCEAMGAGVPAVVTDAGESSSIVGDCGIVVPRSDERKLTEALIAMTDKSRNSRKLLGIRGANRVRELFNLSKISQQYYELYKESSQQFRRNER